jgi:predicted aspartyl protease
MGLDAMGKILITVKIKSYEDLALVRREMLSADQVHSLEVHDAVVDTEFLFLGVPKRLIKKLGLHPFGTRQIDTSAGRATVRRYCVSFSILDREVSTEAVELPDDSPVLVGWLCLHQLDLVVDPVGQCLTGNPEHGGEWIEEFYYADAIGLAASCSRG